MDMDSDGQESLLATQTRYDQHKQDSDTIATVLTTAISELSGEPVEDMPPLEYSINVDSLEGLFRPLPSGDVAGIGEVTFQYMGYIVCIHSTGQIRIYEFRE